MAINTKVIKPTAIIGVTALGVLYKGSKNSTHNTAQTWEVVNTYLKANPKCTRAQLFTHLQVERNHACFVTYALGRGWLAAK